MRLPDCQKVKTLIWLVLFADSYLSLFSMTRVNDLPKQLPPPHHCIRSRSLLKSDIPFEVFHRPFLIWFRSLSDLENQLPTYLSQCSTERQILIQEAAVYFYEAYSVHCEKYYLKDQRSCDVGKIETCLENLGTSLNFASTLETACR